MQLLNQELGVNILQNTIVNRYNYFTELLR